MACVFKRGKIWYAVIQHGGCAVWRSLRYSGSKREARRRADYLEARICGRAGERNVLFSTIAGDVLADIEVRCGSSWFDDCKRYIARFIAFRGDCPIVQFTSADCRRFLNGRLRSGASPTSVRKECLIVRKVFLRAVETAVIEKCPWGDVDIPPDAPFRPRALTAQEAEILFAAVDGKRRLRWMFLAYTGARKGEALRVLWRDINFESNMIQIPNSSKGGVPMFPHRLVPIPDPLRDILLLHRGRPRDPVIRRWGNWSGQIKADCERAGIGKIRVHDLRHTNASWLAQRGVSAAHIAKQIGDSLRTAQRYIHLHQSDVDVVREALNG